MFAILEGASSPNPEPRTDDFKEKEKENSSAIQVSIPELKHTKYFHKEFKNYNPEHGISKTHLNKNYRKILPKKI